MYTAHINNLMYHSNSHSRGGTKCNSHTQRIILTVIVEEEITYTWRQHEPGATVTSRAFRIGGKAPSNYRRRRERDDEDCIGAFESR